MKGKWYLAIIISVILLIPSVAQGVPGVRLEDKFKEEFEQDNQDFGKGVNQEPYYLSVMKSYEEKGYKAIADIRVDLDVGDITASDKGDMPFKSGIGGRNEAALVWEDRYEWFEWSVDIPESGLYEISMEYYPLPSSGLPVQREVLVDGKIPFAEAHNISFPRMWEDEGDPKVNNIGDEVRPGQTEVTGWKSVDFSDNQGMYADPFMFYFSAGNHVIRLNYVDQPAAFGRMTIKSPQTIPAYEEVLKSYEQKGYKAAEGQPIKFQAESNAILKSDPTVRRESNGDPAAEPISRGNRKLNVIGDWRWRKGDQSITWEFEVHEDGLYKIGLRLGQWWGDGLPSYRQISIDGQVPFAELKEYEFKYERSIWRDEFLQDDDGKPYLFYLGEGKHWLTMTVMVSPLTEIIQQLTNDGLLLSTLTRQIIMVTGSNPDPNYEYDLDKRIPGLMDNLQLLADHMQTQADRLTAMSAKKPSMANNLLTIKQQIDDMIADPDTIPRRLQNLNEAQISIGNWVLSMQNMPLVIDYFIVCPEGQEWVGKHSNIFQKLYTTWYNFKLSFSKDYDSVGSVYAGPEQDNTVINVWVARGKEWAEIMKEMADEDFTPKTHISVNMNVVPTSQLNAGATNVLLLSITSGKAPDVALGVSADSPVEFAIRDATVDLSKFNDFQKAVDQFVPGIMIPFKYNGGVYAVPETMNFQALFYRRDIINELGIKIPDTWDDIYQKVLPILYQNGMEFYYPPNFAPFLYQHGGNFYSGDGTKSALDTPEAYQAFKEWTELYTSYGIPEVANFYNRFRSGEMPMGVGGYDLYIQLATAAPELFGRWGIAPMPGHKKQDGTIDRSFGGVAAGGALTGQAAIILSQSEHQQEAWEFLKWWVSADVQAQFGKELEALMGVEARWNTANIEAFQRLPWKREDIDVITGQWKWAREQPVVLGGYFTGRHVNNAWNRVVLGEMNIRDSLEQAVRDINKELRAKQEEYGVAR